MMYSFRSVALVLSVLGATGCSREATPPQPLHSLGPDGSTPIVTSASTYTFERDATGWRGEIEFVFTNRTGETVSLLNCNALYGISLQRLEGDAWIRAWSPALPECLSPPIRLAPDATHQDVLHVFGGAPGSNYHPQFASEQVSGTYRIVIESAYFDYDHDGPPWGRPVPLEERVSNPFEIRTRD